jgi:PKD repeat protein
MLTSGVWDTPVAFPPPVNSKSDDFAFSAEDNLQTGYFSRNSGRSDEIYKFTSTIIRKVTCDSLQFNSYCYEFYEENALKFDTIPFRYTWNFNDGSKGEGPRVVHCFKRPGDYTVTVDILNLITKEVRKNEKTYNMEIRPIEQPYITGPDQCSVGQQVRMDADSTYLPGWNISQYYWNFGDESINISKEVDKVYSKPGVYNIQLIVTSFPDANGLTKDKCVSKNIRVIRQP